MTDVRTLLFVVALSMFVGILGAAALYYYFRARRASKCGLEVMLAQLMSVDRDHIRLIARDLEAINTAAEEDDVFSGIEPLEALSLIGGIKGLDALEANTDVLINLVSRLQIEYPEALVLAERLRLHAREMQWYIGRLRAASTQTHGSVKFPEYAQRATAIYYVMSNMVLTIYKEKALPGFTELERVL